MNDQLERPLELEPETVPVEESQEAIAEAERSAEEVTTRQKAEAEARALKINLPKPTADGMPRWAKVPTGFAFPRGKQVLFLKFKSKWTDTPWKGEPILDPETGGNEKDPETGEDVLYRQCVVWPINSPDKKLALGRAMRDPNRAADEMAKQMIRVADGVEADWTITTAQGIEMFWNELGEKCRGLLLRIFSQLHVLDQDNTKDFLANCIEARSTGG